MGVSENRGTPKSSILIRFSVINHPFWGTTIFGNTHINWWVYRIPEPSTGHQLWFVMWQDEALRPGFRLWKNTIGRDLGFTRNFGVPKMDSTCWTCMGLTTWDSEHQNGGEIMCIMGALFLKKFAMAASCKLSATMGQEPCFLLPWMVCLLAWFGQAAPRLEYPSSGTMFRFTLAQASGGFLVTIVPLSLESWDQREKVKYLEPLPKAAAAAFTPSLGCPLAPKSSRQPQAWWFGIVAWVPLRIPIPFIFGDPIAIQSTGPQTPNSPGW